MAIDKISSAGIESGGVASTNLASGVPTRAQLPAGCVLQVVQTVKSDVFSSTSTSYVDITGMSASITPTSTSNKVLVMVSFTGGSTAVNNIFQYKLLRGASDIFVGDGRSGYNSVTIGGGRGIYDINGANTFAFSYLDSPSTTSSTTYKLQGRCEGGTFRMNANGSDTSGSVWSFTSAASIILMEVAG
jgi:hypothetical protein